ncbi:hypothetical protein JCM6882_003395 [Rhodosporidiobolus microsporus]
MSLEVTTKLTIDWKVEGISALLRKGETEDVYHDSEPFDNGRWKLSVQLTRAEKIHCGLYLICLPRDDDRAAASTVESWRRTEAYKYTVSIYKADGSTSITAPRTVDAKTFSSQGSAWGWKDMISRNKLRSALYHEPDAFVVRCEIIPTAPSKPKQIAHAASSDLLDRLLDSRDCSNIVFAIQPSLSSTLSHIFAAKEILVARSSYFRDLFSNDFCESKLRRLNPKTLCGKPSRPFVGDGTDFRVFEQMLMADESVVVVDGSLEPAKVSFAARYKAVTRSDDADVEAKPYMKVLVHDCSYATYFALINFLYTNRISFLPSISDLLVAFQDERREPPNASYTTEMRNIWLDLMTPKQSPLPCNPHAMYRVADRYLLDELKEIAQGFILRSLEALRAAEAALRQGKSGSTLPRTALAKLKRLIGTAVRQHRVTGTLPAGLQRQKEEVEREWRRRQADEQ